TDSHHLVEGDPLGFSDLPEEAGLTGGVHDIADYLAGKDAVDIPEGVGQRIVDLQLLGQRRGEPGEPGRNDCGLDPETFQGSNQGAGTGHEGDVGGNAT